MSTRDDAGPQTEKYHLLTDLPDLRNVGLLACDLETRDDRLREEKGTGWPFRQGYICGASIAYRAEDGIQTGYISLRHPDSPNIDPEQFYQWVKDHFASDTRFLFHNLAYDCGWLRTEGGIRMPPSERLEDTLALAAIVDENRHSFSLDALCAWRGLPGKATNALEQAARAYGLPKKEEVMANLWQLPASIVAPYAQQDAAATLALFESLNPILDQEGTRAAYRLEMDLMPVTQEMRLRGIRIDVPKAEQARDYLLAKRDAALAELAGHLGFAVCMDDLNRNEWRSEIFGKYGIPVPKTEKGNDSFTAGKLGWMPKYDHWLPQLIVRADRYHDAGSKFVQGYIIDHVVDGRIHAEIHSHRSDAGGARSSRFSYSNPPLQQMPGHDPELTPLIRGVFLPEEGEELAQIDYAQQEYRLIVMYAAQHKLQGAQEALDRYKSDPNTDFHQFVAGMTGLTRQNAKSVNFAKSYGAGPTKFGEMTGRSEKEARELIAQYDAKLPFVAELLKKCQAAVERTGYITLLDGCRRHWNQYAMAGIAWTKGTGPCPMDVAERRIADPEHRWFGRPKSHLYKAGTFKAMNGLVQGSGARQAKWWMLAAYREGVVPLLQMHDALILSVTSPEQAEHVAKIGCEIMPLTVPMRADIGYGRNWGEAEHTWDELQEIIAAGDQGSTVTMVPMETTAAPFDIAKIEAPAEPRGEPYGQVPNVEPPMKKSPTEPPSPPKGAPKRKKKKATIEAPASTVTGDNYRHATPGSEEAQEAEEPTATDDAKLYEPIRQMLLHRGYVQTKSWGYVLPGTAEPLYYEDRYELQPGILPGPGRDKKECRFRYPNGDGQEYSGTGTRRIPYNWPAILAAGPGATLYITEGPNKSGELIARGRLATAAAYHSWKSPECRSALAGMHIIYLEDHDYPDKDGQRKAELFSKNAEIELSGVASSFKIIRAIALWENLGRQGDPPHGWDVKDWLIQGGNVRALDEIAQETPDRIGVVEPIDLWGLIDPPPLQRGWLPAVIENFAFDEGRQMGVEPTALAMSALVVCAGAITDEITLQMKRYDHHWRESARIWGGLIGVPSTKKTPAMRRAEKALRQLETELARRHASEMEAYKKLPEEEQELIEEPRQQRIIIKDVTTEGVQEVFRHWAGPRGLYCSQDEIAGWFGAMDRYNSTRGLTDRAFWMEMYNGGAYPVDRIKRGSFIIENLSANVLGGIQPDRIRDIAKDTVDDGLIQRLIPASHAGGRRRRQGNDRSWSNVRHAHPLPLRAATSPRAPEVL
jgi:DNA polymerase I-like protein with 3'-5' exonuclease and polymerase domains